VKALGLKASVHGVRYPDSAKAALAEAGVEYRGWVPNYEVPRVFANYKLTIHVPRRPYATALAGVPTIRVFEALACGIPLISAPWIDSESLFRAGDDFLFVANGGQMMTAMRLLLNDSAYAAEMAARGRDTVLSRHTCAHRVTELLDICTQIRGLAERFPAVAGARI
jgi:spore maturation protein CgeB